MKRSLVFCLWSLVLVLPAFAGEPALRIKATREPEPGIEQAQHGTAFVRGGLVVTAAHVVDVGEIFVETAEGWIRCKVLSLDLEWDVAILKPALAIADSAGKGDTCFASIRGQIVRGLAAKDVKSKSAIVKGYDHGGSGAPVYRGGKLAGLARGFEGDKVDMVPMAIINEMLESADPHRGDAETQRTEKK